MCKLKMLVSLHHFFHSTTAAAGWQAYFVNPFAGHADAAVAFFAFDFDEVGFLFFAVVGCAVYGAVGILAELLAVFGELVAEFVTGFC